MILHLWIWLWYLFFVLRNSYRAQRSRKATQSTPASCATSAAAAHGEPCYRSVTVMPTGQTTHTTILAFIRSSTAIWSNLLGRKKVQSWFISFIQSCSLPPEFLRAAIRWGNKVCWAHDSNIIPLQHPPWVVNSIVKDIRKGLWICVN